jgi:signal transduction histidine kinase
MADIRPDRYWFAVALVALVLPSASLQAQPANFNFDSLKKVIALHPKETSTASAYRQYAAKFYYSSRDSCGVYLEKALALAQKGKDLAIEADCLKGKGDLAAINGDFRSAKAWYFEALPLARRTNDQLLWIRISSNLGVAYKNLGKMDSAIEMYNGISVAFKKVVRTSEDSTYLAIFYFQLFDSYIAEGFMDDAIYYGDEGYRLSSLLGYQRGIGYGLYVQGLKCKKSDPALALGYCDKALAIAVSGKIPELEVFVRDLRADIFITQGEYRKAEAALRPDLHFTAGSLQLVTWSRFSRVCYYLEDYTKAVHYFKQALKQADSLGYNDVLAYSLENGIAIYQKLGDYRTAYELLRRYDTLKAEMAAEKLRLDYERAALQFQSTQKDKQLAKTQMILEQKNSRLNFQSQLIIGILVIGGLILVTAFLIYRQQQRLQVQKIRSIEAEKEVQLMGAAMNAEEKERSRIARDLHDGIGGILSATKMRFSVLRNEHPQLRCSESYSKALSMLDEASAEIRKTAHNLMPDMLRKYGLDEAARLFCDNASTANQLELNYQSVGEIGRFNTFFELSVYRMVQELVNNIIRHAHARHAYVQLSRQENLLTLCVEDDGLGFKKGGPGAEKGMGLRSVAERVRALGGTVEIDSAPGSGTYVYVELDIGDFKGKPIRAFYED